MRSDGVDVHRQGIAQRAGVASRVGGRRLEGVRTISERPGAWQGPVPLGVGGDGSDQRGAVIDLDNAARFGGAAQGQVVVTGDTIVVGASGIEAKTGDRRRRGRCGVDHQIDRRARGAFVARRIGVGGCEALWTIRQRRGGRDAPVAVGVDDGAADGIAVSIIKGDGVAWGASRASEGRGVVVGDAVALGSRIARRIQCKARRCRTGRVDIDRERPAVGADIAGDVNDARGQGVRPFVQRGRHLDPDHSRADVGGGQGGHADHGSRRIAQLHPVARDGAGSREGYIQFGQHLVGDVVGVA